MLYNGRNETRFNTELDTFHDDKVFSNHAYHACVRYNVKGVNECTCESDYESVTQMS